jgi:hypothetical protein
MSALAILHQPRCDDLLRIFERFLTRKNLRRAAEPQLLYAVEKADIGVGFKAGSLICRRVVAEGRDLPRMLLMKFVVQLVNLDSGLF